jgi:hypothetical protein
MKRKYSNGFFIASSKKLASKTELKNTYESLKKHEVIVVQNPPIYHEPTNFISNPRQDTKDVNTKVDVIDSINLTSIEHKCLSQSKSEIKVTTVEKSEKKTISEKKLTHLNKFKNRSKIGILSELLSFFLLFYGYTMIVGCFVAIIIFFFAMDPILIIAALFQFIVGLILIKIGKKLGGY